MSIKPGSVLHGGRVVGSVEDYLVRTLKALLLARYDSPDTKVSTSGVVKKKTNWEQGYEEGRIQGYLDSLLAVRAGSDYYSDTSATLRTALLIEALEIPADEEEQ